jgi:hypothetical protein
VYGAAQSRPERIQELRRLGCSYRFFANLQKCRFNPVSQSSAPKSPMTKIGRPTKITAEVSSNIDTLSSLDSALTNAEIAGKIQMRWPNLKLSLSSVSAERIRLGFTWRPHLVKQELSVAQEHQRLQSTLDIRSAALDLASIVFSDESRFVHGDDRRWRHLRRGEWNETAFMAQKKIPGSVIDP